MIVYRLIQAIHGKVLNGVGAAITGGRWNSPGTAVLYTAANRSLAMAEVAVHFTLTNAPTDYMMMIIEVPVHLGFNEILPKVLPTNWNQFPPSKSTHKMGDKFILDKKDCLLKVPSVVTKGDFNFLINPAHPDFTSIKIIGYEPFSFDRRLFKP